MLDALSQASESLRPKAYIDSTVNLRRIGVFLTCVITFLTLSIFIGLYEFSLKPKSFVNSQLISNVDNPTQEDMDQGYQSYLDLVLKSYNFEIQTLTCICSPLSQSGVFLYMWTSNNYNSVTIAQALNSSEYEICLQTVDPANPYREQMCSLWNSMLGEAMEQDFEPFLQYALDPVQWATQIQWTYTNLCAGLLTQNRNYARQRYFEINLTNTSEAEIYNDVFVQGIWETLSAAYDNCNSNDCISPCWINSSLVTKTLPVQFRSYFEGENSTVPTLQFPTAITFVDGVRQPLVWAAVNDGRMEDFYRGWFLDGCVPTDCTYFEDEPPVKTFMGVLAILGTVFSIIMTTGALIYEKVAIVENHFKQKQPSKIIEKVESQAASRENSKTENGHNGVSPVETTELGRLSKEKVHTPSMAVTHLDEGRVAEEQTGTMVVTD